MTSLGSFSGPLRPELRSVPWSSHGFLLSPRFSSRRLASSPVVYVQTQADLSLIALEGLVVPPFLKGFLSACILLSTFTSTQHFHQQMFAWLQLLRSIVTRHQVFSPFVIFFLLDLKLKFLHSHCDRSQGLKLAFYTFHISLFDDSIHSSAW